MEIKPCVTHVHDGAHEHPRNSSLRHIGKMLVNAASNHPHDRAHERTSPHNLTTSNDRQQVLWQDVFFIFPPTHLAHSFLTRSIRACFLVRGHFMANLSNAWQY